MGEANLVHLFFWPPLMPLLAHSRSQNHALWTLQGQHSMLQSPTSAPDHHVANLVVCNIVKALRASSLCQQPRNNVSDQMRSHVRQGSR